MFKYWTLALFTQNSDNYRIRSLSTAVKPVQVIKDSIRLLSMPNILNNASRVGKVQANAAKFANLEEHLSGNSL